MHGRAVNDQSVQVYVLWDTHGFHFGNFGNQFITYSHEVESLCESVRHEGTCMKSFYANRLTGVGVVSDRRSVQVDCVPDSIH